MALEGRLDEFDPDSVELPEDNIDDEAEDRRFGRCARNPLHRPLVVYSPSRSLHLSALRCR